MDNRHKKARFLKIANWNIHGVRNKKHEYKKKTISRSTNTASTRIVGEEVLPS